MTTLSNLPAATLPLQDLSLIYVVAPESPSSRKTTISAVWPYVLGPNASSARGFFGAPAVVQPSGATQAAVVMSMTAVAAATVGAAVATTAATNTSPYGFTTAAQANDLVSRTNQIRADMLAVVARTTESRADIDSLTTLVNRIRSDLVALGLIKGGA